MDPDAEGLIAVTTHGQGNMKRLVGAAGVFFAVFLAPGMSHAQEATPPCEAPVVDTSGRVADVALVRTAAEKLALSANAYVRVRVESGVGDNAEARVRTLQAFCPDWMSGGIRRRDLIVVLVLPDTRQTGIYFGSSFNDTLEGRTTAIQSDSMNPRFKEGFFDIGVADGLDAIGATIAGRLPLQVPASTPSQYPSGAPAYPNSDTSPVSDSGSSGAGALLVILAVAAIAGIVVWLNKLTGDTGGSIGGTSQQRRATGWFGGASDSGSSLGSSSGSSWGSSSSSSSDSSWSSSDSGSSSSSGSSDGGGSSTSW
jgi:uncharacterized membrane protein YgcG